MTTPLQCPFCQDTLRHNENQWNAPSDEYECLHCHIRANIKTWADFKYTREALEVLKFKVLGYRSRLWTDIEFRRNVESLDTMLVDIRCDLDYITTKEEQNNDRK